MFVLGHRTIPTIRSGNELFRLETEPVPEPRDLGYNGTYGAFRMLEQDCDAFEEFLDRNSGASAEARELLAAKMCGRWRNGRPLTLAPHSPLPAPAPGATRSTISTTGRPSAAIRMRLLYDRGAVSLCPDSVRHKSGPRQPAQRPTCSARTAIHPALYSPACMPYGRRLAPRRSGK
jgi:hypothetical protein